MVSLAKEVVQGSEEYIIFRLPVIRLGFYIAQYFKNNGRKGVGRPQDYKNQLKKIKEMLTNGETAITI